MTIDKHLTETDDRATWEQLGDYAAEIAMKIQATPGAPKRFIEAAWKLIRMHRQLRPEQYGPPRNDEPDFDGELIEAPEGRH